MKGNWKIAALAIAATCWLTGAAQANTRILVNCFWPPQHFVCQEVLRGWKADVEEATERRVRVSFPAQSMAPPPEQLASVRAGIFDATLQFNGFIANEVVGPMVAMMPFASSSDSVANSVALWRTYEKFMADTPEYEGVELLSLFAAPGADFYSMNETPIASLSDATARKMWALPGVTSETLKSNGGAVVSGPAVQMTEIIQRGVVDGFVGIPASDTRAFNVLPYAKSTTRTTTKIFAPVFSLFIGAEKWAEISPEDQAAVRAVSGEKFARLAGGVWGDVEKEVLTLQEDKLQVFEASAAFEAELRSATEGFVAGWEARAEEKGIDGAAALAFYREQVQALQAE